MRIFLRQMATKWLFNFSLHPTSVPQHHLEKTEPMKYYIFIWNAVLLLNKNNAQNISSHVWNLGWHFIQFQLPAVKPPEMSANYVNIGMQTEASIMLCSRPIQTSPVTSWIHKHSWTSSGRHTAAQQSNLVKNWLLGPQIWTDKNYWRFFHALQHVFCLVGFPEVVQTDVGRGGNLNSHSIASCVINTTAKNYINLIIFLQVMINNVADVFSRFFV